MKIKENIFKIIYVEKFRKPTGNSYIVFRISTILNESGMYSICI